MFSFSFAEISFDKYQSDNEKGKKRRLCDHQK